MKKILIILFSIFSICVYGQIPEYMNNEQVIEHIAYTVSYNNITKIPNWVHYKLTSVMVYEGTLKRSDKFVKDPLVKKMTITNKDYAKSGYDRGHMVPAADMNWAEDVLLESFYFSNICPQNPDLNRGQWAALENQVRKLANRYQEVEIYAGPIFYRKYYKHIGKNKIAIPEAFYKVVIVNSDTTCYIMPNKKFKEKYSKYKCSIEEVQKHTTCKIRK